VSEELRTPAQFEAAAEHVREDDLRNHVRISSDLQQQLAWLQVEEAEVDPGFEQVSKGDEATVEHNVLTTVCRRRALGLPDRDSSTELSDSPAEDEAANDELGELKRCTLQDLPDKSEDSTNEDDLAATEIVTHPRAGKRTEKSTDGERSNDSTLLGGALALQRTCSVNGVDLREVLVPVLERQETAYTRLVVSKENKSG